MGSTESMVWPPAMGIPARVHTDSPPSRILRITSSGIWFVGMPVNQIPLEVIRKILEGGESVCTRAGIPIAGGHTIDSVEPIYGLVAIGLVDPANLKRNAGAKPGDKLVLGKPLGIGILSAALK